MARHHHAYHVPCSRVELCCIPIDLLSFTPSFAIRDRSYGEGGKEAPKEGKERLELQPFGAGFCRIEDNSKRLVFGIDDIQGDGKNNDVIYQTQDIVATGFKKINETHGIAALVFLPRDVADTYIAWIVEARVQQIHQLLNNVKGGTENFFTADPLIDLLKSSNTKQSMLVGIGTKRKLSVETSKFYSRCRQKRERRPIKPSQVHIFPKQVTAFAAMDRINESLTRSTSNQSSPARVWSKEFNNRGGRRFLVATTYNIWEYLLSVNIHRRNLYEIIREGYPCKLYFDLEYYTEFNKGSDPGECVKLLLDYTCKALYTDFGVTASHKHFLTLESSTEKKISYHIVANLPNSELFADNISCGEILFFSVSSFILRKIF